MSFTTNKKLSAQAAASASGIWGAGGTTGVDLNTGVIGPIDTILAGVSTFSVTGATIALDFVDGGGGAVSNAMWRFTGAMLQNAVASPNVGDATTYLNGFYYFANLTSGSFTVTVTTAAGSVVLPQGRRGTLFIDSVNGPSIVALVGSSTADPVPAGSSTLWYNTAAPSGWTAVALNDYGVKIVTNGSGGVLSGSVAYSTLFTRTATDGHALTTAELATHTHPATYNSVAITVTGPTNVVQNVQASGGTSSWATNSTGSGTAHSHDLDMRVLTAAFTVATRN